MMFRVYIAKWYFPREIWPKTCSEQFESWGIIANSRREAANKIWGKYREELLNKMIPHTSKLPRRVSLHVNSPNAGATGLASRLSPIMIKEE